MKTLEYFKTKYADHWLAKHRQYETSKYYTFLREHILQLNPVRVLECGIGTGYPNAVALAEYGIEISGVDLSDKLLFECRRNFHNGCLNVDLAAGDMTALPFKQASFDLVYCISSSWYVQEIDELLREMFRVCVPGGES